MPLTTNLWPQLKPLLRSAKRPARYINHEYGATPLPATTPKITFAMVYPDTYELGQANQAVRILCNVINAQEGMWAERVFLPEPEFCDTLRAQGIPLFSLESCAPVSQFDVVGITLPHELAATNVLEVLSMAGLPLRAQDRKEDDPIVVGGGPCAYNPEPYAPFFDVITIGEGEEATPELVSCIRDGRAAGKTRRDILADCAKLKGQYVPSFYEVLDDADALACGYRVRPTHKNAPQVVMRRVWNGFADSAAWEPCVVPFCEVVHDRLNVEILRGCTRGCRFCQAGMMYRPVRERSAQTIIRAVKQGLAQTGYDEVSLTSLSSTDHSQIKEILTTLNQDLVEKGIAVSLPSQRLDSFGVGMAQLVAGAKRGGLTFAPEAGTQRLRDVINKNVTEDDVFSAIDTSFAAGWRRVKLYFMIGLPTETDDDIKGIASLAQRAYDRARNAVPDNQKGNVKVSLSCALFVPKSQTPFQWEGQIPPEEALRRVRLLRNSIKYRAIDVKWHDPETSFVEAVMSRGGRECADVVQSAFEHGARFDAWTEYFNEDAWRTAAKEIGVDVEHLAQVSYDPKDVVPWQHISCGVNIDFLRRERMRALEGATTPDCSFGQCSACGVCPDLNTSVQTQEVRHV